MYHYDNHMNVKFIIGNLYDDDNPLLQHLFSTVYSNEYMKGLKKLKKQETKHLSVRMSQAIS